MKKAQRSPIWDTVFETHELPIFKFGKKTNMINLMGTMSIRGPSTTHEIAKSVLSYSLSLGQSSEITFRDTDDLANDYRRIINKRSEKNSYIGLVTDGFVTTTGIKGKNNIPIYFLTFKGCLFALGLRFSGKELRSFVKNASEYFLFFAYLNMILEKTSIAFIKEIFIKPIAMAYRRLKLILDEYYDLSFPIISLLIGDAIDKIRFDDNAKKSFLEGLKVLIKKTPIEYTNYRFTDDMLPTLYSNKKQLEFFKKHHAPSFDSTLLTNVCREIRFRYERQKPIYLDNGKTSKKFNLNASKMILTTAFY